MYGRTSYGGYGNELSEWGYGRAIAFFTLVMTCIAAACAYAVHTLEIRGWALAGFMLATFGGALLGIFIYKMSEVPVVSFLGVALMCACMGLMIGPLTGLYPQQAILDAVLITAGVMIVMSILGLAVPRFFLGIGPYLMAGLALLIVVGFGQIILSLVGFGGFVQMTLPWTDWVGIVIFSLFVGFDWARAMELDFTWDNAIDTSGSLFLDALNLFLRILARRSD